MWTGPNKMFASSNKTTMSMRRLLTVLVILAVLLAVGAAVAAQQVTTIEPHDLQTVPDRQLSAGERLAQLHKALSSPGDPHDVILEIRAIGAPTSVPFLIEALAKMGTVPREGLYGAIDTRFHVLEPFKKSRITMAGVMPKTGDSGTKK